MGHHVRSRPGGDHRPTHRQAHLLALPPLARLGPCGHGMQGRPPKWSIHPCKPHGRRHTVCRRIAHRFRPFGLCGEDRQPTRRRLCSRLSRIRLLWLSPLHRLRAQPRQHVWRKTGHPSARLFPASQRTLRRGARPRRHAIPCALQRAKPRRLQFLRGIVDTTSGQQVCDGVLWLFGTRLWPQFHQFGLAIRLWRQSVGALAVGRRVGRLAWRGAQRERLTPHHDKLCPQHPRLIAANQWAVVCVLPQGAPWFRQRPTAHGGTGEDRMRQTVGSSGGKGAHRGLRPLRQKP